MSDSAHLLISFASSTDKNCLQALRTLSLPVLERLLSRLTPAARDTGDETSLSMPHERALARLLGLPGEDGHIPWAARDAFGSGLDGQGGAWARITPCHWRVGSGHVEMDDPGQLGLSESHSRALLATMQTFFEADGIALHYHAPLAWLARGPVFQDLPTASLDRAIGHAVDHWMPRSAQAAPWRRLQQEMQMLLYTHVVNDERQAAGQLPVNSFWVSDAGTLANAPSPMPAGLRVDDRLRPGALAGDWSAWCDAWRALDADECTRLTDLLDSGHAVALTLCGSRHAQTFHSEGSSGWMRRLRALVSRPAAAMLLQDL